MTLICAFGDEYLIGDDNVVKEVATRLNCNFENFAERDTSNNRIQYNVTQQAIEKQDQDVIFVIGWTDPARFDAYENESNQYFTYRKDKRNYNEMFMNKLHKFDHYLFDSIVINQKWASQVYGVQQLLENKNIKYFMFNTNKHLDFNKYNEKVIRNFDHQKYYDSINQKGTLDQFENLEKFSMFLSKKIRSLGYVKKL